MKRIKEQKGIIGLEVLILLSCVVVTVVVLIGSMSAAQKSVGTQSTNAIIEKSDSIVNSEAQNPEPPEIETPSETEKPATVFDGKFLFTFGDKPIIDNQVVLTDKNKDQILQVKMTSVNDSKKYKVEINLEVPEKHKDHLKTMLKYSEIQKNTGLRIAYHYFRLSGPCDDCNAEVKYRVIDPETCDVVRLDVIKITYKK